MPNHLFAGRRLCHVLLLVCGVLCSRDALAQPPVPASPALDHSQEAVVIEQARTLYRFEKDGTGRREMHMRVKIQSEAGVQHFGQLVFGYNSANERPEIAFVRVRKPDGTVVSTPVDGVQDLSAPVQSVAPIYTDFRQKHVTVQGLRPGDTLEFAVVTTIHTALAPGQFWIEYEFQRAAIALDEQLDIDIPADSPVTLKTRTGFEPSTTDTNGRRVHHWARANLKRQDDSQDADKPKSDEHEVAAIRLTTFQSWEQVGRWYAALEAPQRVPTEEIRKKAAELVAGRTSDMDKLEALYEFVAPNFRYVSLSLGAGRYQPRQAADVLREQYGDCKDKHTLLASLIDAAGLGASAVLINSSAKLDPAFPSPSQFDHVITRAMIGGEAVWVDTTTEVAPFRLLSFPLRNKQALVADARAPRLENTPANPPSKSVVAHEIDATLRPGGKLDAHVRLTLRGDLELMLRSAFRSTPTAQWKVLVEQMAEASDGAGEVSNWKVSEPAALKEPFTIEFDVSLHRFAEWTSSKITVPLPFAGSGMTIRPADDADDTTPVQLGAAPSEASYSLRLALPPGVTVRTPLPVMVTRDYADYRTAYTATGSSLSAARNVTMHKSELPADRRQDYAAFVRVVAADARQSLALETTAPVTAAASAGLKVTEVNKSAYDALEAGNYEQALTLFKRVVELEPKHKTAWTNLGRAHMGLRQTSAAIEAFRTQIQINPYDPVAHDHLGNAYMGDQRYAEAESAFLNQLEMNPLDDYAHGRLGQLYLERRQYDRAIGHLEKVVTLKPDSATAHIQMAKGHLNLKRDAEAMAAFDRAVELSPTPLTWNNIAYELSLKGVHLDRALQYAESAVSATTAASRNLDVSRADDSALAVVNSLASYWDTLGWVYFAKGDIARAHRYVDASWSLAQHAEVGDHLAQIYEKLGRREDAIKTYALALGAERPADGIRERLVRLSGKTDVDALISANRSLLTSARTFRIDAKGAPAGTAEFFVLFSSAGVEGVRHVSGDQALRTLAEAIKPASYGRMFPDDVPAKILRRGVLSCSAGAACTFTLMTPNDATPVK
jgi:tetratricopeptide (TPR) repeat protein